MVAASVLPVSIYKNKLYFLFGKENEFEDSSKGFSDFGGRVDSGEKVMEAAYREGSEELMGFLGSPSQLKKRIQMSGGTYKINYVCPSPSPSSPSEYLSSSLVSTSVKKPSIKNTYHVNIFFMEYDPNLPIYYNQHYQFIWNHPNMNKRELNGTKLFEKQEIRWFSIDEMKTNQNLFRGFYVNILNEIISQRSEILKFIKKR